MIYMICEICISNNRICVVEAHTDNGSTGQAKLSEGAMSCVHVYIHKNTKSISPQSGWQANNTCLTWNDNETE